MNTSRVVVPREFRFSTRMHLTGSQQPGCKHFVHSLLCCYIKDGASSVFLSTVVPSWHQSLRISHCVLAEKCPQSEVDFSQAIGSVGFCYIMSQCLWYTQYHCTAEVLEALYWVILHNNAKKNCNNYKLFELTLTYAVQLSCWMDLHKPEEQQLPINCCFCQGEVAHVH